MSIKESLYNDRDSAFGQAALTLRNATGLTQVELAKYLGISRRAVGEWERGITYPNTEHLKTFIALAVEHKAFSARFAEEEIHAFWHAAHQKVSLDEAWLAALLSHAGPFPGSQPEKGTIAALQVHKPRVDWGDALAVTTFYGREWELTALIAWVVEERCRMVSVLGLGGIGKSALAIRLMRQVAEQFEVVIWRSLRDAPACESLLDECLQILAPQELRGASKSLERRLDLLLECMRRTRVLLVLDNLEMLLEEGQSTGYMRPGYEGYARLLRMLAETEHQGCLLLTSREEPGDIVTLKGKHASVRVLRLARLDSAACEHLLAEKEVVGTASEYAQLSDAYAGNPLALKIVAPTIVNLFDGEIAPFLELGEVVIGGVRELLDEQYARLPDLERMVLYWLAIVREPASYNELLALLVVPGPVGEVLDAIEALRRRSLIELGQRPGSFTLQSVVLEYITARLIAEAANEIQRGELVRLVEHGLELASVKEYIRQTQRRLFVTPLLARVRTLYSGRVTIEERLLALLDGLRARADYVQGYGPANLLALLREQRGNLRGLDLSRLSIRGACLQGVEMQDASLAESTLRDTTYTEAVDAIRAVAIGGDGRYWAAGSWRGTVQIWQQGGKILHKAWQAHAHAVSTLAFSSDGSTLTTGGWDGAVKQWDVERGELLWSSWRTNNIQTLVIAPDGRMLASGGNDAVIQLWDAQQGVHYQMLSEQHGPVYALGWSPAGDLLASGGLDAVIRLWAFSGRQLDTRFRTLTGHTDWVFALAFAPDGRTLASGSFDRTVKLWDMDGLRERATLTGHTNKVRAVTWSPDGRILASCSMDQTICLWDAERASYRTVLQGHTAAIHAIAFTPDGRNLLSGSDDGTLRVWDVESGQCVHIMQGYAVSLYDLAWSPDGTRLASAGSDTLVSIWDVRDLTPSRQLHGHSWIVHGVAWSPDGRHLASCGWDGTVRVWDAQTGVCVQLLRDPDYIYTFFYGVAWSPDGKFLASGSYQQGILVWEAMTGKRHWIGHISPTMSRRIEWSPDGTQLISCSDEGDIYLWDASDGTRRAVLQGHAGMVESVAWSPDGTRLASGGGSRDSGVLAVWDACSWRLLRTWSVASVMVYALAWGPTGTLLVSGSSDGMLHWWDMQHETCVRERKAHQGTIQALKTSPDGRWLASCGDDNAIHVWDLENGDPLYTLRRDRPYERLNITGMKGVTGAQREVLRALGAFDEKKIF